MIMIIKDLKWGSVLIETKAVIMARTDIDGVTTIYLRGGKKVQSDLSLNSLLIALTGPPDFGKDEP
jgi:hypothetical protein